MVRNANIHDFNIISALVQRSKKEVSPGLTWSNSEIEKTLHGLKQNIIAVAENGCPLGFAAGKKNGRIWMEEGDFYFAFNYIIPEYRSRGIADSLSNSIIEYGRKLGSNRIIMEPVTIAGRKHAKKIGFNMIKTETYFEEKPNKIIRGKDGIDTYIYYVDELQLQVPDHIGIMDL